MKAVVARLARRIKEALALRQRRERRGKLDPKRTFRASLQYEGVPVDLRWRRRHRDKPRLVTLCDVSDSVRNASRFMLQLVWNLQDCFSKVQSFVFVSEIAEVSEAFRVLPVERAVEFALGGARVDYHSRSDFGYAFARFTRESLERLDRKTTVLVLGDARNNYNDPQAWALRLIRERVKGVIWLNPEGQWGWGVGDSVMPLYAPPATWCGSAGPWPSSPRWWTGSSRGSRRPPGSPAGGDRSDAAVGRRAEWNTKAACYG